MYIQSALAWFWALFGLILGSFFNVCIMRIPLKSFWKSLRSQCAFCDALIPFWLNIPIISYVYLKGRSKCCQRKISVQYPIVEFMSAFLFAFIFWKYPFIVLTNGTPRFEYLDFLRFLHAAIFSSLLLICSFIDLKHKIIPDVISLPMIAVSPLIIFFHPELDWRSSLYGVLLGGGSIYIVQWLYYLIRKKLGIGMGDAKLLAAIGGWLGYQAIFPTLFYGSILGSIFGVGAIIVTRRVSLKTQIPFGPFLAVGAFLHLFLSMKWQEIILY